MCRGWVQKKKKNWIAKLFFIVHPTRLYGIIQMTTIKYQECKVFQKDVKRLSKKFKTLREDLETAKEYSIELFHREN